MRITPIVAVAATLVIAGCTSTPAPTASGPTAPVAVATTTQLGSVLADITQCAGSTSATLMGPGDDPHTFAVSSTQVAEMVRAKLVVANGLGLEEGLTRALDNVRADGGAVFEVAPTVDPLPRVDLAPGGDHDDHAGHDHGVLDPHVWMDVKRMATAAKNIGAELTRVTNDPTYATCGVTVQGELEAVDAQMRQTMSTIPAERRILVTDHEAFGYFALSYDFTVAGVVIPGGSTDAEPSSAGIAALVATIKEKGVSAIFSNNTVSPRLVESVAAEVGGGVKVVRLYEGSVGAPGTDAATYAGMMLANARLIAEALA